MVRHKQWHLESLLPSVGPVPHGRCTFLNRSQHVGWPDRRVSALAGKRYAEKGNVKPYLFCVVRPPWERRVWLQTCLLTGFSPQILVAEPERGRLSAAGLLGWAPIALRVDPSSAFLTPAASSALTFRGSALHTHPKRPVKRQVRPCHSTAANPPGAFRLTGSVDSGHPRGPTPSDPVTSVTSSPAVLPCLLSTSSTQACLVLLKHSLPQGLCGRCSFRPGCSAQYLCDLFPHFL